MRMSVPTPTADLEKGVVDVEPETYQRPTVDRDGIDAILNSSSICQNQADQHNVPKEADDISRIPTHESNKPTHVKLWKSITARSNANLTDPGPPPDGGIKAWTQVCMGHLVVANTWGMVSAFGAFQTYYTQDLGMEPSAVSWIGSMQMFCHFGLGMFTGRLLDIGYYRWSLVPGICFGSLGMFMTSICSSYWQFFFAQGVMIGLGCGLQFPPSLSLVSTYFSSHRSIALSIMAAGSATGGLVYPTIVRQLLPVVGFAWTVRAMGFIMLGVGCCYALLLKPRLPPRKSAPMFELSAFREPPYALYVIGIFLFTIGLFFAFYYVSSYARDVLHTPYNTSINLLLMMNGLGLIGRLIPGLIADRLYGPFNTVLPFCLVTTIILYCWTAVSSVPSLYAFASLYGFFSAGFQGLFPATLTTLTKDMSKAGTRTGMGLGWVGVSSLIGPPIAGALVQSNGGDYTIAIVWGASMMLAGTVIMGLARISLTGWKFKVRV
ncbi:MFS general substrate transporter [Periconia macrospinosa]|uniref:MFS general substrate transporter n=1 Tax=Periconia macrospinosa TaxID=97972 RepID=A0A2V1D5G4_9PLEO|nr:MFS general substrate transporter [Periconia macrospinosa]